MRTACALGLLCFAACAADDPLPVLEIGSVEVQLAGECPAQATVVIEAGKGACDEPLPPVIERRDHQLEIQLMVESTAEVCAAVLDSYQVRVTPSEPFAEGEYQVVVPAELNTGSASFRVAGCP